MFKYIFTFILVSFFDVIPLTAASNYLADSTVWSIRGVCAVPYPCVATEFYNYYLNGDTLINATSYRKVYRKGSGSYQWFSPVPTPPSCQGNYTFNDTLSVIAFLRQDSQQIRIWDVSDQTDKLLYDFNLKIGDTLQVTFNNFQGGQIVSKIDSFLVKGYYRKRFTLQNSTSQYLVEGIGHSMGFLEPFPPIFDCGYELACYSIGDTSYYPSNGTTCNISIGITEFSTHHNVVFPNPAENELFYSLPAFDRFLSCEIYDVNGNLLLKKMEDTGMINIRNITAGIYFILLRTERNVYSNKFVKK